MNLTTDGVVQMTFMGEDDKAFRHERREKRKKSPNPPAPVGACCANCRLWVAPRDGQRYGSCTRLLIVTKRESMGPEKGQLVTPQQASRFTTGEADALHTTAGYAACMAYEQGIERTEAA